MDYKRVKDYWNHQDCDTSVHSSRYLGMPKWIRQDRFAIKYRELQEETSFNQIMRGSLRSDSKILEVGCGGGRWSFYLSKKVRYILGIDIADEMIRQANHEKQIEGFKNIDFVVGDIFSLTSENKFDIIYFSGVLQYVSNDDLVATLSKAKELLSPHGIILSRDTICLNRQVALSAEYPCVYRTKLDYENAFKHSGFFLQSEHLAYSLRHVVKKAYIFYKPPLLGLRFAIITNQILYILQTAKRKLFDKQKANSKDLFYNNPRVHIFALYEKKV